MICAYINGKIAYPVAESDIKITLQNPFIKDGDEKSMEVVFPLDIPENREVFGPLNRLDTSFENIDYDDCRLMADNFVVVSGKGTVTSVTNTEVKIQILAGKSYLRYKASFDHIFIDELDYGQVANKYKLFGTAKTIQDVSRLSVTGDLNSKGFIGVAGQYVFMPVHDEGDDIWANAPAYIYEQGRSGSRLHLRAGAQWVAAVYNHRPRCRPAEPDDGTRKGDRAARIYDDPERFQRVALEQTLCGLRTRLAVDG